MAFPNQAHIEGNPRLRVPQREGWVRLRDHFNQGTQTREVGIILPVGCGKSGLIALTPFALQARRVLVIAPGTRIRKQLADDLKASSETNFYDRCGVIPAGQDLPQAAVMESGRINVDDLRNSDFAVANIQQIAGEENRWLDQLDPDFFDLILVDEAHHNPAESWQQVKNGFLKPRLNRQRKERAPVPLRCDR